MKKTGILEFRYGHSESFAKRLRRKGSYTINLGDWIQSLAVQRLVESLGPAGGDSGKHLNHHSRPAPWIGAHWR